MRDALYCASAAARESSRPLRNAFKQNKCRWIDAKSGACATGFPCLRPHLGTVLGIPLSFNPDGGPYSTKKYVDSHGTGAGWPSHTVECGL